MMSPIPFPKTILAITLSCFSIYGYAATINPQPTIGLSQEIANQYSGEGVKVGVVDSGFSVDHPLANKEHLRSLTFTLTDPDGKQDSFNPNIYDAESTKQGTEYSLHGGPVAGVIGAKSLAKENYAGGIAPNSIVYLTSYDPVQATPIVIDDDDDEPEPSLLLTMDRDIQYARKTMATALNHVAKQDVLAINNSWNENPVSDDVKDMDTTYQMVIQTDNNNILLNAIKQAVKQDRILVFAAGNESMQQAGIFAALPRYLPELESHYLSVVSIDKNNRLHDYSNHCGITQNWCIAAPGSLTVLHTTGFAENKKIASLTYEEGTSFAAPVATGSLALLKQRFPYFSPTQIRDTLLTTATDIGAKGVDSQFGWGVINLGKAIHGPAQLLRDEVYTVSQDDVWSNRLLGQQYAFTKQGNAALALNGQNNQLQTIDVQAGKLALNGKTSARNVFNHAHLAVADLTVNQQFQSHANSTLELVGKQGITAQGQQTSVALAGKLAVNEQLHANAVAGETVAHVVQLKDGATYQGGFDELAKSNTLSAKGLRQDVYFKDKAIEVAVNPNQAIRDTAAEGNGTLGLNALNKLRDSRLALKRGLYNDWLQQALAGNHAQGLHYHIGNGIYADSVDWLRSHSALDLQRLNQRVHGLHDLPMTQNHVWLEQGNDNYTAKRVHHHEAADLRSRHTELGMAHKLSPTLLLAGTVTHTQADVEKTQANSRIKQTEANVALHYMPNHTNGWFAQTAMKAAQVKYRQNRMFNKTPLGAASNTGRLWGAEARTGYRFAQHDWQFEPHLGVQAIHLNMKGLQEAGELGIHTPTVKQTDWNLTSGVQVKKALHAGDWVITPDLAVNYIRRLNHGKTQLHGTMAGVDIDSTATTYGKNQVVIGSNLTFAKNKWLASVGMKHHLLNHGKGNSWHVKLGLQF